MKIRSLRMTEEIKLKLATYDSLDALSIQEKRMAREMLNDISRIEQAIKKDLDSSAFLTIAAAAAYVQTCAYTLKKAIKAGELSCFMIGERVRLKKSDLEDWILKSQITGAEAYAKYKRHSKQNGIENPPEQTGQNAPSGDGAGLGT